MCIRDRALSDRISIIRNGRIIESGTLAELRHLHDTTVEATLRQPPVGLEHVQGLSKLVVDGVQVKFSVESDHLDDALAALGRHGVTALTSQPPSLEELFLAKYEGQLK